MESLGLGEAFLLSVSDGPDRYANSDLKQRRPRNVLEALGSGSSRAGKKKAGDWNNSNEQAATALPKRTADGGGDGHSVVGELRHAVPVYNGLEIVWPRRAMCTLRGPTNLRSQASILGRSRLLTSARSPPSFEQDTRSPDPCCGIFDCHAATRG